MTKDQIYELLKTEAAKRCDAHWLGAGFLRHLSIALAAKWPVEIDAEELASDIRHLLHSLMDGTMPEKDRLECVHVVLAKYDGRSRPTESADLAKAQNNTEMLNDLNDIRNNKPGCMDVYNFLRKYVGPSADDIADLAKANASIAELEKQYTANEDTIREQYGQMVAYREAIEDLETQLTAMQQRAELAEAIEAARKEATTPALKALVELAQKQNE